MADDLLTFYGRGKSRRLALPCFKYTDSQKNLLCWALIVAGSIDPDYGGQSDT